MIFSDEAQRNIALTGNVWGTTTEYVFKFSFILFGYMIRAQQKRASNFMGRFGGGWQWVLGAQISRGCVILNLLVMSIRFDKIKGN
jgi:hypothetical protein